MRTGAPFRLRDLPLPAEPEIDGSWTRQMREWVPAIGALGVLRMVDALGGQMIYVPKAGEGSKLAQVLGEEAATAFSAAHGGEHLQVPLGETALARARRAPVLAAIRAGEMAINEAVPILRMTRTSISHLVNHSDEGADVAPLRTNRRHDPRQDDLFRP